MARARTNLVQPNSPMTMTISTTMATMARIRKERTPAVEPATKKQRERETDRWRPNVQNKAPQEPNQTDTTHSQKRGKKEIDIKLAQVATKEKTANKKSTYQQHANRIFANASAHAVDSIGRAPQQSAANCMAHRFRALIYPQSGHDGVPNTTNSADVV